jgi:hypothetical protein
MVKAIPVQKFCSWQYGILGEQGHLHKIHNEYAKGAARMNLSSSAQFVDIPTSEKS